MINLEKIVFIEYILDLIAKRFPPRLCIIKNITNHIIAICDRKHIGPRWARNFVQ